MLLGENRRDEQTNPNNRDGVISNNDLSVKMLASRVPCSVHHRLWSGIHRDDESRLNMHRDPTYLRRIYDTFLSRQTVLRSSLLDYAGFENTLGVP